MYTGAEPCECRRVRLEVTVAGHDGRSGIDAHGGDETNTNPGSWIPMPWRRSGLAVTTVRSHGSSVAESGSYFRAINPVDWYCAVRCQHYKCMIVHGSRLIAAREQGRAESSGPDHGWASGRAQSLTADG
ncbi:hypothetical protein ACCO45_003038 [Purpureocillium lilacinum]|uniref:Uncharacterized protein n=1 Tax=Purpureocillium lilacinum TaxID=33203 RepID=A0ACC4DYP7_PURLI